VDRSAEVEKDEEGICIICEEKIFTHIDLAKMIPFKEGRYM
jgi:hypothetical protein